MAEARGPQARLSACRRWALPHLEQLERPDYARAVAGLDRGRGRRVALGQLGVQGRAARLELRGDALAQVRPRAAGAAPGRSARPAGRARCRRRRSDAFPASSAASISARARAAKRPAENVSVTGTNESSRCSSAPVRRPTPRRSGPRARRTPAGRRRRSRPDPPPARAGAPRGRSPRPSCRCRSGRTGRSRGQTVRDGGEACGGGAAKKTEESGVLGGHDRPR